MSSFHQKRILAETLLPLYYYCLYKCGFDRAVHFTTITSWALLIWKSLESEGLDAAGLFAKAGIDTKLLNQSGARYSSLRLHYLWQLASQESRDKCFFLEVKKHWHPTTFHALGIAWFASPTLLEAFQRLIRHASMISTGFTGTLEKKLGCYVFTLKPSDRNAQVSPEGVRAALVVFVHMCRDSLGAGFKPKSVCLPTAHDCDAKLADYFGCEVCHDTGEFSMTLNSEDLELKLPTANFDLLASSEHIIADYLKKLDNQDIVSKVRVEIIKQLPSGQASEENIASALNISLRTMQRKLSDNRLNYRELLTAVRKDMAEMYIANPVYSITEISYLLGFAEQSSFSRSYKQWTGHSPSADRRRRLADSAQ